MAGALAVALEDLPAALHAQVAAEHEAVLEAQEQVLADGLDLQQAPTVEALRDPRHTGARVRRLDRELLPDEDLEAPGRAVEGVTFGHRVESVCILD